MIVYLRFSVISWLLHVLVQIDYHEFNTAGCEDMRTCCRRLWMCQGLVVYHLLFPFLSSPLILTDPGLQRSGTLLHWFVVVVLPILEDLYFIRMCRLKIAKFWKSLSEAEISKEHNFMCWQFVNTLLYYIILYYIILYYIILYYIILYYIL